MATQPGPGISRNRVTVKPIEADPDRSKVEPDFRDVKVWLEARRGPLKNEDTDIGKAISALYDTTRDLVKRVNTLVDDAAMFQETVTEQLNDVLSNLRRVDDAL